MSYQDFVIRTYKANACKANAKTSFWFKPEQSSGHQNYVLAKTKLCVQKLRFCITPFLQRVQSFALYATAYQNEVMPNKASLCTNYVPVTRTSFWFKPELCSGHQNYVLAKTSFLHVRMYAQLRFCISFVCNET